MPTTAHTTHPVPAPAAKEVARDAKTTVPAVRYATMKQVKKVSKWSIKKYAEAFKKLAE